MVECTSKFLYYKWPKIQPRWAFFLSKTSIFSSLISWFMTVLTPRGRSNVQKVETYTIDYYWYSSRHPDKLMVHSLIWCSACVDQRRCLWGRDLSPLVLGDSNCWRGSYKYSSQLTLSIYSTKQPHGVKTKEKGKIQFFTSFLCCHNVTSNLPSSKTWPLDISQFPTVLMYINNCQWLYKANKHTHSLVIIILFIF